jgi:PleD family two-component response regulator
LVQSYTENACPQAMVAVSGEEVIALFEMEKPDLVLMDVVMLPGMDRFPAAKIIKDLCDRVSILVSMVCITKMALRIAENIRNKVANLLILHELSSAAHSLYLKFGRVVLSAGNGEPPDPASLLNFKAKIFYRRKKYGRNRLESAHLREA